MIDTPEPVLRSGEVMVAPAFSAISSGTEMHIIQSTARVETTGEDTYPSLRNPNHPQLRKHGKRWPGPAPREQIPGTASIGYSLAGTVIAGQPARFHGAENGA